MVQFHKPENALKRARELIEIGEKDDALQILINALTNKRFTKGMVWTVVMEDIMLDLLRLCHETDDLKTSRDGLIAYRSMTQTANIASLTKVVVAFRELGEKKVATAVSQAESKTEEDIADLDELDTPMKAYQKALQPLAVREQEARERKVVENVRFLWETYKQILDVFKTNGKTEELYNDTARRALQFCQDHQRNNELKKLCDLLRNNYLNLFKKGDSKGNYPAHAINPSSKETVEMTLATRAKQLQIAADMELWRECFATAEDIQQLMLRQKPKFKLLVMYYDFLSQICWKSSSFLFHAYAMTRIFKLHKVHASSKAVVGFKEHEVASISVMAMLCVPDMYSTSGLSGGSLDNYEALQAETDKMRKLGALFNVNTIPTKETLKADLVTNDILMNAYPCCKNLFKLMDSTTFAPIKICQLARPILEEIEGTECLKAYAPAVREVIFYKLLRQLGQIYTNITVDALKKLVDPLIDFSTAESWMITKCSKDIRMDYVNSTVIFKTSASAKERKNADISKLLSGELAKVPSIVEEQKKAREAKQQAMYENFQERVKVEKMMLKTRIEEMRRRQQLAQEKDAERMSERLRLERNAMIIAKQTEDKRFQMEKERRAIEGAEAKKRELDNKKIVELIENMKALYSPEMQKNIVIVEGEPPLSELTKSKMEEIIAAKKIDLDGVIAVKEGVLSKEKGIKVNARKGEYKRIDFLARALREQEISEVQLKAFEIKMDEDFFFQELENKAMEEGEVFHVGRLEMKSKILENDAYLQQWMEEQVGAARVQQQEEADKRKKEIWADKCARAKERHEQHVIEEEARRKEAEILRKKEEEKKKKMEERLAQEEKDRQKREYEETIAARREKEREDEKEKEAAARKQRDAEGAAAAAASGGFRRAAGTTGAGDSADWRGGGGGKPERVGTQESERSGGGKGDRSGGKGDRERGDWGKGGERGERSDRGKGGERKGGDNEDGPVRGQNYQRERPAPPPENAENASRFGGLMEGASGNGTSTRGGGKGKGGKRGGESNGGADESDPLFAKFGGGGPAERPRLNLKKKADANE